MRNLSGWAWATAVTAPLATLALAGCAAGPSPAPSGAALPHLALTVAQALAWFEERTLSCLGPAAPSADAQEWLCRHEFLDGSTLTVRITGDVGGVLQLVGVTSGLEADDSAGFLVSSVAIAAVPVEERAALERWTRGREESGGVIAIGPALVELRPHSPNRAVVVSGRAIP